MTDHVLIVRAAGWFIQHPPECVSHVGDCAVLKASRKQAGPPTKRLGSFAIGVDEKGKLDVGMPCKV